jgi:hypothetical protein
MSRLDALRWRLNASGGGIIGDGTARVGMGGVGTIVGEPSVVITANQAARYRLATIAASYLSRTMPTKYWFPAKRYGWGWGFPTTWQGRLVFGSFLGLVVGGAFLFPPRTSLAQYLAYVVILSAALASVG